MADNMASPDATVVDFTRIALEHDLERVEFGIRGLEHIHAEHAHYLTAYRLELVSVAKRLESLIKRVPG